jgi:hypothetical protein
MLLFETKDQCDPLPKSRPVGLLELVVYQKSSAKHICSKLNWFWCSTTVLYALAKLRNVQIFWVCRVSSVSA